MAGSILVLLYTVGIVGVIFTQDCDFDGNVCNWINSNWTLTNYISASDLSGPRSLFDGGYIYLDTLGGTVSVATLTSLPVSINGDLCFLFRYHMKSLVNTMGTLSVAVNGNLKCKVYNISGHQGNEWRCGRIYLSPFGSQFTLQLTGYRLRQQPYSTIALDGFHFLSVDGSKCQDNLQLLLQDCDAMYIDSSSAKTSLFTDSRTASTSSSGVTTVTTTTTPASSDFLINVIAAQSSGMVLLVIFIIVFLCWRKQQQDSLYFGPLVHLQKQLQQSLKVSTQITDYTILPAITQPQAPPDVDFIILPIITKLKISHDEDHMQSNA